LTDKSLESLGLMPHPMVQHFLAIVSDAFSEESCILDAAKITSGEG